MQSQFHANTSPILAPNLIILSSLMPAPDVEKFQNNHGPNRVILLKESRNCSTALWLAGLLRKLAGLFETISRDSQSRVKSN